MYVLQFVGNSKPGRIPYLLGVTVSTYWVSSVMCGWPHFTCEMGPSNMRQCWGWPPVAKTTTGDSPSVKYHNNIQENIIIINIVTLEFPFKIYLNGIMSHPQYCVVPPTTVSTTKINKNLNSLHISTGHTCWSGEENVHGRESLCSRTLNCNEYKAKEDVSWKEKKECKKKQATQNRSCV